MDYLLLALISVTIFWVVLTLVSRYYKLKKRGWDVWPFFLHVKSKRIASIFQRARASRVGRVWGDLGIALGFGQMVLASYLLILSLQSVLAATAQAAFYPLIPGVTFDWRYLPYMVLAAAIVLITHEFAHGHLMAVERIPIKSVGVFIALILLGGYVEPDENVLKKSALSSQLRIFSVGSTANLAVGLIGIVLISVLFPPSGLLVISVSRPEIAGEINPNDVIYAVNSTSTLSVEQLEEFMRDVRPGETLVLTTNRGNVTITAGSQGERAVIGVVLGYPFRSGLGEWTFYALNWVLAISLGVALFNMLPMYPLDGGRMLQAVLDRYSTRFSRFVVALLTVLFISLFAVNIAIVFGLVP